MQIQLEKAVDVAKVESTFAKLWSEKASALGDDAVLRARVANLLVYTSQVPTFNEVSELIPELTAMHPSRVVLMKGERGAPDRDIELHLMSLCQSDKKTGATRLCCEQVDLKAEGKYVSELPSAAIPLLVSDLSTFLWWRDVVQGSDEVFKELLEAADRLVIDSAEFQDSNRELKEMEQLLTGSENPPGVSDLNWARLTFWRALMADFYDVPSYRPILAGINHVRIDYVAPSNEPKAVAPQAALFAGWLASRLGWNLLNKQRGKQGNQTIRFAGNERQEIILEFRRVEASGRKQGRLAEVELRSEQPQNASFKLTRSGDNLHLLTEAKLSDEVLRGRVLPVRNRSVAQLLGREMEILGNDQIYQDALSMAATLTT